MQTHQSYRFTISHKLSGASAIVSVSFQTLLNDIMPSRKVVMMTLIA
jgi:hypothetical protein